MMTEVKGLFKEFLDCLKLSIAPLEVVAPTNKVAMLTPIRGKLLVIKFLYLVVEIVAASLPMLNLHLLMEDRFPPLI